MDLLGKHPAFDIYGTDGHKIYARNHGHAVELHRQIRGDHGELRRRGLRTSRASINHSIISTGCTVGKGAEITDSVIMPDVVIENGAVDPQRDHRRGLRTSSAGARVGDYVEGEERKISVIGKDKSHRRGHRRSMPARSYDERRIPTWKQWALFSPISMTTTWASSPVSGPRPPSRSAAATARSTLPCPTWQTPRSSNIGIVTKYNYQSLMDHLGNCEEWDLKLGEGVRFLPPYATGHTGAYRGKLEALQTAHAGPRPLRRGVCRAVGHHGPVRHQLCRRARRAYRLRLRSSP